eukprot:scaffold164328_cov32-Tisochrysis_lutea.AAC.2
MMHPAFSDNATAPSFKIDCRSTLGVFKGTGQNRMFEISQRGLRAAWNTAASDSRTHKPRSTRRTSSLADSQLGTTFSNSTAG